VAPPRGPDGNRLRTVARLHASNAREAPPPAAGPIEMDEPSSGGQARVPSQPSTPRSRPRSTASTHPLGMWFCPTPRCARREGASPTGWSCLQSLVSHLRPVHLSTGASPPDAWLDTHGLRLCLACREIIPQGSRCPGTTAVLAALALDNTAPPAQARSPLAGHLPPSLDLVLLLGTRIPTLRRVPIAASSTCARALTCLLQALDREHTSETLARLLLFPRIALAAPARGGKAGRSSSTQQCRLNCLAAVMDPMSDLITRILRHATTDGPRTRAQSRAAAPEVAAASPKASDRTAAAVRALLAEGALGRAPHLLTSDGVCDSADPAVLARLRELHPLAEGPNLEPPYPEDRPDVAGSWASDQLLEMEAVVRSFPPGSAAGPSGLRPHYLLDCLSSADSAAKAVPLEALLTQVTATSSRHLQPRAAPYLCAARPIPLRNKDGGKVAAGDRPGT